MSDAAPFSRVAVLGTGLIGGSFALAVRRRFASTQIVGWDRPEVLARAIQLGVIQESAADLTGAVRAADLIYVALPIGVTIDLLPAISCEAAPGALVTDACSTKTAVCKTAENSFRGAARFLGGHPMAGREAAGIENASAHFFLDARYAVVAKEDDTDPRVQKFARLLRELGAQPVSCDAETHDWAAGIVSHLPQLVSVALAHVVLDETDETGLPVSLAGSGLRDTLRLAGSPYEMWRDICLTNSDNIRHSLDRVIQALESVRSRLMSRELADEFQVANELYKILHQLK
jgi:prephenate dehydrogenase